MRKEGLKELNALMARRGIVMPAYAPYGELAGFYDYGPIGVLIKHNIENAWRKHFIIAGRNVEMEANIVGPAQMFRASGHLANFTDPIVTCLRCKSAHRADKLVIEALEKEGREADAQSVPGAGTERLSALLSELGIRCDACGGSLGKVETFNLMMATTIGAAGGAQGFLRPETAQGIFVDFKVLFRAYSLKLPAGIGQIGRVFRNEISPRRGLLRMREFSQMELEYFFDPADAEWGKSTKSDQQMLNTQINVLSRDMQERNETAYKRIRLADSIDEGIVPNALFAHLLARESAFIAAIGIDERDVRFRQMLKDELPHYSRGNVDLEVKIDGRFEEVAGNAYRADFDLSGHQRASGESMEVLHAGRKLIPHVVEISFGTDRLFLALLSNSLYFDEARGWEVLALNEAVAPYKYSVFPLQKDEALMEVAERLCERLSAAGIPVNFSASGSIGKRYARSDEIGVGTAVTVDYQTLEEGTVTLREMRDTKQRRVRMEDVG